jgi:hypothetical protein
MVYGAMTLALLLFIAVVALTARQPPPPSVAEFAPQAVEQIKNAPNAQSSRFGNGADGSGTGEGGPSTTVAGAAATTSTTRPIKDVARIRHCIGDPPRQIEDAQSPPCVNYWEGDNGGDLGPGVTKDTIRIAVSDWDNDVHPALQDFFNRRFEFYGRQILLVNTKDDNKGASAEQQNAAAVAAKNRQVFAADRNSSGGGYFYYKKLAELGIISVAERALYSEAELSRGRPYQWQYMMPNEGLFTHLGQFVCSRLKGGTAKFTNDATLLGKPRTFGVVVQTENPDYDVDDGPLLQRLKQCGVDVAYRARKEGDAAGQANNFALQLKQRGITDIICICMVLQAADLARAATSNGYFPEWVVSSYNLNDHNFSLRSFFPSEQRTHLMGISAQPRQVRPEDSPARWAARETRPDAQTNQVGIAAVSNDPEYRSLLLLASGIQMAGPHLTPQTFEAALQRTVFPSPPYRTNPGRVGFAGRSHGMTTDVVEFFWSDTATSPYTDEGKGSICYPDGGVRRTLTSFPTGDNGLFTSPCDSGA